MGKWATKIRKLGDRSSRHDRTGRVSTGAQRVRPPMPLSPPPLLLLIVLIMPNSPSILVGIDSEIAAVLKIMIGRRTC